VTGILLFQVWPPDGTGWATLDTLTPASPEGSITSMTGDGGRDVLLFRCEGARSVIWRSAGGVDFEDGPNRVVMPLKGREMLAELHDGGVYEQDVRTDRGIACRARWTHREHG
jgi:hypothetical protein